MPRLLLCILALAWLSALSAATIAPDLPPGGANAAPASEPWPLVGARVELPLGNGQVRIPSGDWEAPAGGAEPSSIPGPVVAIAGSDGVWRGQGYLETWTSCTGYQATHQRGEADDWRAAITYHFADDRRYRVALQATGGRLLIEEESGLGVRDLFVFDCYYHWQPTAAAALGADPARQNYLYLPCHYDRAEATISIGRLLASEPDPKAVAGLAVLSPRADATSVLLLQVDQPASWNNGDRMGVQLWQRRQRANDPASRHFLGPETKSDGTPNPHTAAMIGRSSWEGHVTIEARLGTGSRRLVLALAERPDRLDQLPAVIEEALHE